MSSVTYRGWSVMNLLLVGLLLVGLGASPAWAQEMKDGGIEPGKWVLGMRAGFAPLTQTQSDIIRSSTDVGSLVNFEALYSLNNWLLVGMMLEWERHAMSAGSLDLRTSRYGFRFTHNRIASGSIRPHHSLCEYEFRRERQQLWRGAQYRNHFPE